MRYIWVILRTVRHSCFFVYREVANYSTASKGVAIQTESRNVTSIKIRRTIKFLRSKRKSRKSLALNNLHYSSCNSTIMIFLRKGVADGSTTPKGGERLRLKDDRDTWLLSIKTLRTIESLESKRTKGPRSFDRRRWMILLLAFAEWLRGDPGLSRHESAPRLLDASVYVLQRVARDRWKVWCARSVERCWSLIHFEKKDKNEEEERNFNFVRVVRNTTTSINGGIINRFSRASVKRLRAKEGNTTPQERGGGCPISGDACEKRWNYVNILQTTITTRRD